MLSKTPPPLLDATPALRAPNARQESQGVPHDLCLKDIEVVRDTSMCGAAAASESLLEGNACLVGVGGEGGVRAHQAFPHHKSAWRWFPSAFEALRDGARIVQGKGRLQRTRAGAGFQKSAAARVVFPFVLKRNTEKARWSRPKGGVLHLVA